MARHRLATWPACTLLALALLLLVAGGHGIMAARQLHQHPGGAADAADPQAADDASPITITFLDFDTTGEGPSTATEGDTTNTNTTTITGTSSSSGAAPALHGRLTSTAMAVPAAAALNASGRCANTTPQEVLSGLNGLGSSWVLPLPGPGGQGLAPEPLQRLWALAQLQLFGFDQLAAAQLCDMLLQELPDCAMCHWCLALAHGPNPNKVADHQQQGYPTFGPEEADAAGREARRALGLASEQLGAAQSNASQADQFRLQLITASAARFANASSALSDWGQRERAYAQALEQLGNSLLQQLAPPSAAAAPVPGDNGINMPAWCYVPPSLTPPYANSSSDNTNTNTTLMLPTTSASASTSAGGRAAAAATALSLAAEALMNLSPWEYYSLANGQLQLKPHAQHAEQLLLCASRAAPGHPLPLHLLVHITEGGVPGAGRGPLSAGRGEASADALAAGRWPQGHLQHMPSHTYLRLGRWADAVRSNHAAYETDVLLSQRCLHPYAPDHNLDMLLYAASTAGMLRSAETAFGQLYGIKDRLLGGYMGPGRQWVWLPLLWVRFGQWGKVLATLQGPGPGDSGPSPAGGEQFALFVGQYARLMAMASPRFCPACWSDAARKQLGAAGVEQHLIKGMLRPLASNATTSSITPSTPADNASNSNLLPASPNTTIAATNTSANASSFTKADVEHTFDRLQELYTSIPPDAPTKPGAPPGIFSPAYKQQAEVLLAFARSKLALMSGNATGAALLLQQAVGVEDSMGYTEPPRMSGGPVRPCLCWLRRVAGDDVGSVEACSADLREYPGNVWSLAGLMKVAERQVNKSAAGAAASRGDANVVPARSEAGAFDTASSGCGVADAASRQQDGATGVRPAGVWSQVHNCLAGQWRVAAVLAEVPVQDSCLALL